MGQLQGMDELEQQIQQAMQRGNIQDIDPDNMEALVDEESRRSLEQLQRLAKMLEDAGYVTRKGDRLELTPKGIRKIGQKAMKDVFSQMKRDRLGNHDLYLRGAGGDHTGETKTYEFGDNFDIHLERTVRNALLRDGSGVPIKLTPADFEVHRTEHVTQASTVLLLDQSRSMGLYGSFQSAKKVAMALASLIRSQFPRDKFYIVGFSDYAIELKEDELPQVSWNDWVSGTNMHHAFLLSRKLLLQGQDGDQADNHGHGRRAYHTPGGRPRLLQLSSQPSHHPGDPKRGEALHPGRHNHQHFHAGKQFLSHRLCGQDDAHQQGPGLLLHAPEAGRIRAGGLRLQSQAPHLLRRSARVL